MDQDSYRYLEAFVADARAHLAGLETSLVGLESRGPSAPRALLEDVFRHLHSLKGGAASVGLETLARIAHAAESLVAGQRADESPSAAFVDLLLEATDELRTLVSLAEHGESLPATSRLEPVLARAAEGSAMAHARTDEPPLALPAEPHRLFVIRLAPGAATVAIRAFVILRHLQPLGVLASQPNASTLRAGGWSGSSLTVALRGEPTPDAVTKALARVPDVLSVEILPPAGNGPSAESAPTPFLSEQSIPVSVVLVDQLLDLAGELVLQASRLHEAVRPLPSAHRAPLEEEVSRLRTLVKDLGNQVLTARQTPLQRLTTRLPRMVRDLSQRVGKPLVLSVQGADVTLDRGLLEALAPPLLHALRNAADHGIESPDARRAAHKPEAGALSITGRREREHVIVELRDDGRGFDLAGLRAKAVRAGALSESEAQALSDEAAHRLAFLPGVSTRDDVNDVSGRGVGMDVVLRDVERLGGTVQLTSESGRGSIVRFVLPASVSVMNLLLVGLGSEIFGIPMSRVHSAAAGALSDGADGPRSARAMEVEGEAVPSFDLARLLGLQGDETSGPRPVVVVEGEGGRTAVAVDRLVGQEEVLLRPLGPPVEHVRGLAGAAVLGSGRPIFVLDIPRLVA